MAGASVRILSSAVVSGSVLTVPTDVRAGDYVALILHRNTQSAAPSSLPGWLALLGHTSGTSFGGSPHSASIYGGYAPTSITEIVIPDLPNNSFAVLAAIEGVAGAVVQHSAATAGFPSPLPGFSSPGGCLLVLLEAWRYSGVFGVGQPGTQVTVRNVLGASGVSGRITVRRVEADTTGNLPLANGVSGSWRGGMAIAVPLEAPAPPAPPLDAPVTLHMSESLTGVFADPTIDAAFFQLVDLPVGSRYSLGDQLSNGSWYSFTIRDRSISGGLATYSGETLLARLHRHTPIESLIIVAGEGGVPATLTLRECLRRFLDYYGVPYDPDLPEFYLRVGDEILAPTVDAFVIQPDQENPESVYHYLERFFGPFRGYTFRADVHDRLVVTPPAWVDIIGVRLTVYRRRQPLDRYPVRNMARAPWSTTRAPLVAWEGTVNGAPVSGSHPTPLVEDGAPPTVTIGGVAVRLYWTAGRVQVSVWPPAGVDVSVGDLYSITFTVRPETAPGDEDQLLTLTVDDLSPDESTNESADTVINQAVLPVRRRTFAPDQQVMQAAAMVLKSPPQLAAGSFGHNFEYGPMAEDLVTPGGFLELVNDAVQSGTWFWPVDDAVVIQPGGNITVAYEVEEWAEGPYFSTVSASMVNSFSDTVELPASGAERKLFDFQFPRQTSNFAPSPYGAQGSLYGRWRAGENPGIEVRLGNARFAEFGYVAEFLGVFGQTYYFLWGAIVKLNGTGTTFTVGDLETYRFGFSRGENGLWEGDANVPGLSESQALYPNRVYQAPELPYEVTAETALALARGIVEENLTPKVVHQLTIEAARPGGYAVAPWHFGRAARVPALGVTGRVTALDYSEAHTAQGSSSTLTIDVETTAAPAGSRAAAKTYRRAAYGLSTYQQED